MKNDSNIKKEFDFDELAQRIFRTGVSVKAAGKTYLLLAGVKGLLSQVEHISVEAASSESIIFYLSDFPISIMGNVETSSFVKSYVYFMKDGRRQTYGRTTITNLKVLLQKMIKENNRHKNKTL